MNPVLELRRAPRGDAFYFGQTVAVLLAAVIVFDGGWVLVGGLAHEYLPFFLPAVATISVIVAVLPAALATAALTALRWNSRLNASALCGLFVVCVAASFGPILVARWGVRRAGPPAVDPAFLLAELVASLLWLGATHRISRRLGLAAINGFAAFLVLWISVSAIFGFYDEPVGVTSVALLGCLMAAFMAGGLAFQGVEALWAKRHRGQMMGGIS